jgi:RNA polymerase sigma factor (sigma-70 family)
MDDELQHAFIEGFWDSRTMPGPDAEFEALVKKYGRFMADVARHVLSGYRCCPELVKEVVQDALLAVYKDMQRRTVIENRLAYLRTVTARRAVNIARSLNRRNEHDIEDEQGISSRKIFSKQLNPSQIYELRVMYNMIFSSLSETQRVILDMWLDGMSGDEIGLAMGMTRSSVNVAVHRARRKFKPMAEYLNW